MSEKALDMIFRSLQNLYRSGAISAEDLEREVKRLLELMDNTKEYLINIAGRLLIEAIQYLVDHAQEFNEALHFLLSLQSGRMNIDSNTDLVQRIYEAADAIERWVYWYDMVATLLGKPRIRQGLTMVFPDGLKIRIQHKPSLGIHIEYQGKMINIFVNDARWSYPTCPALHICVHRT